MNRNTGDVFFKKGTGEEDIFSFRDTINMRVNRRECMYHRRKL